MKKLMSLPLLLVAFASAAYAHPELGSQPDSTAEVELRMHLDTKPQDAAARKRLAFILYRKNKHKEAEREFAQVVAKAPQDAEAHYGLGLVLLKEKKAGEAAAALQKSLGLKPEESSAHLHLGQALEQLGRATEAEASYRRGLGIADKAIRSGVDVHHEQGTKKKIQAALQKLKQKGAK